MPNPRTPKKYRWTDNGIYYWKITRSTSSNIRTGNAIFFYDFIFSVPPKECSENTTFVQDQYANHDFSRISRPTAFAGIAALDKDIHQSATLGKVDMLCNHLYWITIRFELALASGLSGTCRTSARSGVWSWHQLASEYLIISWVVGFARLPYICHRSPSLAVDCLDNNFRSIDQLFWRTLMIRIYAFFIFGVLFFLVKPLFQRKVRPNKKYCY